MGPPTRSHFSSAVGTLEQRGDLGVLGAFFGVGFPGFCEVLRDFSCFFGGFIRFSKVFSKVFANFW